MPERFYSYDDIGAINALDFAIKELGLQPIDGRDHFNCPWRHGSDSGALQIGPGGWTDYTKSETDPERSGGLVRLVALTVYNGDDQEAQQFIGDRSGLSPKVMVRQMVKGRAAQLEAAGYACTNVYNYHDENGAIAHMVLRYEHPDKLKNPKEFVQRTPKSWSLKDVRTYLYRLPEWIHLDTVCLCEGEKDADNVVACGIPATTNPAGAGRWEDYYTEWLRGKHVVIMEDNDDAGRARTEFLLWTLKDVAATMRVLRFPELSKGGDVSDWLEQGHTAEELVSLINALLVIEPDTIENPSADYQALTIAKQANKTPLCNYTLDEMVAEDGKTKQIKVPRWIGDITKDVFDRFLNFPRRIGENLFDHDRDSGEITIIRSTDSLYSWMQRKSKHNTKWPSGEGFVSRAEIFEAVFECARRYHSIAHTPNWPTTDEVYYAHPPMPAPDPEHTYWKDFISFFDNLHTPADVILFQSFVASPLYHIFSVPKPVWMIDSIDGQGAGKTKLVDFTAYLYGSKKNPGAPIKTTMIEMRDKPEELNKRLLSDSGRQARIVLWDNAVGLLRNEFFASLITASTISGRRSYGKGEESRPNNLTYAITANGATLDADLTHRAFFIDIKRPIYNVDFDMSVIRYIEKYRLHIIADLIDILETAPRHPEIQPITRCARFERDIVQAFCNTIDDYEAVHESIQKHRSEANVEEDWGRRIVEAIYYKLVDMLLNNECAVFIRSEILRNWVMEAVPELKTKSADPLYQVTTMSKSGFIREANISIRRYPYNPATERRMGIMWVLNQEEFDIRKNNRTLRAPSVGTGKDGKPAIFRHGSMEVEV